MNHKPCTFTKELTDRAHLLSTVREGKESILIPKVHSLLYQKFMDYYIKNLGITLNSNYPG